MNIFVRIGVGVLGLFFLAAAIALALVLRHHSSGIADPVAIVMAGALGMYSGAGFAGILSATFPRAWWWWVIAYGGIFAVSAALLFLGVMSLV